MITGIDFQILDFIQEHFRCVFFDILAPIISLFGDMGIFWIGCALLLLFVKKDRRAVVMLICLAVGALCCNVILKPLIARPRPCWINEAVRMAAAVPTDFSFPSGHTVASVIAAVSLTKINKRFKVPVTILAVLIALSRVYLYVHYPSDVIIGAAIGFVVAEVIWKIYNSGKFKIKPRRKEIS